MDTPAFDHNLFAGCAARIVSHTRELAAKGWTPATAGNFSIRMGPGHAAITISGKDKGRLTEADIMVVDMTNQPVATHHRPSAGLLHADAGRVRLRGYELFKALRGHDTHEAELDLAVVPNSQDMDALIASVDALLDTPNTWGYLIAGHGLYAWGHDIAEARRHLDAFEFMLGCELDLRRLRA